MTHQYTTDRLGEILIDGYLKGKLQGYKFRDTAVVIKWKPLQEEFKYPLWQTDMDYYGGDRVTYEGQIFEAELDSRNRNPGKSEHWMKLELRSPLSIKRYMPFKSDTMPKSQFLRNMIAQPAMRFAPWSKTENYYAGDRVYYSGKNYEAMENNSGREPGQNTTFWMEAFSTYLSFSSASEIDQLQLFQNYVARNNSDTLYYPQMISIGKRDSESFVKPVLHFYYDDAINYLNSLHLPAIYFSETGYIGHGRFVIDEDMESKLPGWLKSKIKEKKLEIKKGMILREHIYNQWLNDTAKLTFEWRAFQSLKEKDLILNHYSYTDGKENKTPFLIIKKPEIERIFKQYTPKIYSFATAIQDHRFEEQKMDVVLDSMAMRKLALKPDTRKRENYYLSEEYESKCDTFPAPMRSLIYEVGRLVAEAYNNKKIFIDENFSSHYPAAFDWSKIGSWKDNEGLTYNFNRQFSIGFLKNTSSLDSVRAFNEIRHLLVSYQTNLNAVSGVEKKPEVKYIAFALFNEIGNPTLISFSWNNVKTLIQQKSASKFKTFIDLIENGKIIVQRSKNVHGLVEAD